MCLLHAALIFFNLIFVQLFTAVLRTLVNLTLLLVAHYIAVQRFDLNVINILKVYSIAQ